MILLRIGVENWLAESLTDLEQSTNPFLDMIQILDKVCLHLRTNNDYYPKAVVRYFDPHVTGYRTLARKSESVYFLAIIHWNP